MTTTHSLQNSQQLAGTRWRLDPSGSSAGYSVPNFWGLVADTGRFERLDGWLEVDQDDRWRMELTIDAAGVDTGNARRDKHLRSPDFFDAEQHPEVRFRSRRVIDHRDGRLPRVGRAVGGDGLGARGVLFPAQGPLTTGGVPIRPARSWSGRRKRAGR